MSTEMAPRKGYGQFCPVARAAEVVAERWTPLVLRELIAGSHRFNELRQGVPLMSPSLLSQRLRELEDAGVVEKKTAPSGHGSEYHLTTAGEELRPIIVSLGVWGSRWVQTEVRREDLDPALLMWDIRRRADRTAMPEGRRTVIRFDLSGAPRNKRRWWLVFDRAGVDLCLKDPGYSVDLTVSSDVQALTDVWIGHLELDRALRIGAIRLEGRRELVKTFRDWFALSLFAPSGASRPSRNMRLDRLGR